MCRLLGIIANRAVDINFSLLKADKPFKDFGSSNPHGWGIGWYERKVAKVYKEGISIQESQKFSSRTKEVCSPIVITHVRYATRGKTSRKNAHPFKYENWLFAHNGSVDRDELVNRLHNRYIAKLQGDTDSEVYFYCLLQCIENTDTIIDGIKEAINVVVDRRHTGLNFLLSNGKRLYAFRYSSNSESYYSLYYLKRDPDSHKSFEFISNETRALIQSKSRIGENAVLVCSEKLTEENWIEVPTGKMLIIDTALNIKEVKIL